MEPSKKPNKADKPKGDIKQNKEATPTQQVTKTTWYKQNVVIILALLLLPLIGLLLTWLSDWNKKTKIIVTVIAGIWAIVFSLSLIFPPQYPPTITVKDIDPKKPTIFETEKINVSGSVSPSQSNLKISVTYPKDKQYPNADKVVNEKDVIVGSDGKYNAEVALSEGDNQITLTATNEGKIAVMNLNVKRLTAQEIADKKLQQPTTTEPKQTEQKPAVDTSELKANVTKAYDIPGIEITNLETVAWYDCKLRLNSDYKRTLDGAFEPNSPLNNPYGLFTKSDGTRFNNATTAPKNISISCKVNGQQRDGYYVFK